MTEAASLKAELRKESGKGAARRMRREGRIPAVIYGRGEDTRSLSVDAHEFEVLMRHVSLDNTLIDLNIKGKRGVVKALVGEVQTHPFKPAVLHVDFLQIHAGETVRVQIPVKLEGTPEGVKEGGVLQHVLQDLEITCLAEDIPESIVVDISALAIGDSIHVYDLEIPEGVELEIDESRTVALVAAPRVIEEPEPEEELEEVLEPELIGREEEGVEAEAGAEEAEEPEPEEE